ncbi:MFS transporter [Dactylosporangium sp. CA-233914]|uniref:MFS transporter n=1 Tax=Dactylosporangium sp. CA-233914 TaxID=3239934 RepID=UPI003D8E6193
MTIPASSNTDRHPVAATEARVRAGAVWAFLGAYLGAYLILIVPVATTLAIKVAEVAGDGRAAALGVITGLGALVALIAGPVFGFLSDRTTSRWGRRRPWILGGAVVGVAALLALAISPTPLLVGLFWCIVQLALNATLVGLAAFLPDRVPQEQRGKVSAWTGIAQQTAPLIGLVIANVALGAGGGTLGMFVAPSVIGLILVVVFTVAVDDPAADRRASDASPAETGQAPVTVAASARWDFAWAWIGRFLITLSFAAANTYQVYFLNDRLDIPLETVPLIQLGLVLLTTVLMSASAAASGIVSDRIRRRKPFVIVASILIATSSLLTAFAFELPVYIVASAITGVAIGAYFAIDLALVTEVLPDRGGAAARDMGVFNIANTLPQSLAPAGAPLLLAIGGDGSNYAALFVAAAGTAVFGAIATMPIRGVR